MQLNIAELQKKIKYDFSDSSILREALTHSSYANEKKGELISHNERLEFLGDSVLSIVISDYLFSNHKDLPEGDLTKIRSKIVCEATLAECSRKIKLGHYMYFGKGEEMTGGRERTSILADAYEALIAAIYRDGGIDQAGNFILREMKSSINNSISGKIFIDYKTHLQEIVQVKKNNRIKYEIINEKGPDHCKVFCTNVLLNDKIIGFGEGRSKKESEQNAAKMALERVGDVE